jgi:hypothetical protein
MSLLCWRGRGELRRRVSPITVVRGRSEHIFPLGRKVQRDFVPNFAHQDRLALRVPASRDPELHNRGQDVRCQGIRVPARHDLDARRVVPHNSTRWSAIDGRGHFAIAAEDVRWEKLGQGIMMKDHGDRAQEASTLTELGLVIRRDRDLERACRRTARAGDEPWSAIVDNHVGDV